MGNSSSANLFLGDCLEVLKTLPSDSIDSCVTDAPYGLSKEPNVAEVMQHWINGDSYKHKSNGFMGKSWDSFVPGPEYWREVYRVLKPGSHILVFASTRTWDLMSVSLRFAGFENRDTIASFGPPAVAWLHGQGFPKAADVSKMIDKEAGVERKIIGPGNRHPSKEFGGEKYGEYAGGVPPITAPATAGAKKWSGWKSALKPAWEVALMFRKPLAKGQTIAGNVLEHGTGALNIDASRIEGVPRTTHAAGNVVTCQAASGHLKGKKPHGPIPAPPGRFPANIILSEDAAARLDEQSGVSKSPNTPITQGKRRQGSGYDRPCNNTHDGKGVGYGDSGGSSRFFKTIPVETDDYTPFIYQAKAPRKERFQYLTCNCETVKPEQWRKPDLSQCEQTDITSPPKATCEKTLTGNSSSPTSSSGNELMDQFQKECRSTTSITTQQIIESETFNSSPRSSTSDCIAAASLDVECGSSPAQSVESLSPLIQTIGTSHPRATRSMGVAVNATLAESLKKSVCEGCGENPRSTSHPTQKPLALCKYLITLITQPGGTVLDPFAGSGSTLVAAKQLGFDFIGIEMDAQYFEIMQKRIEAVK